MNKRQNNGFLVAPSKITLEFELSRIFIITLNLLICAEEIANIAFKRTHIHNMRSTS